MKICRPAEKDGASPLALPRVVVELWVTGAVYATALMQINLFPSPSAAAPPASEDTPDAFKQKCCGESTTAL